MLIKPSINRYAGVRVMRGRGMGTYVLHPTMYGDGFLDSLKSFGRNIWGGIKSVGRALAGSARATAKDALHELKTTGKEMAVDALKNLGEKAMRQVSSKGSQVISALSSGDRARAKELLKSGASEFAEDAKAVGRETLERAKREAVSFGSDQLGKTRERLMRKVENEVDKLRGVRRPNASESTVRSNNILDGDEENQLAILGLMNGTGVRRMRGKAIPVANMYMKPNYKLLGRGIARM